MRNYLQTWKENKTSQKNPHLPSLKEVERLSALFPDIPMEAIFKEDMLRTGISFSRDALQICSGFKPKAYFIFSFDLAPLSELKNDEDLHSPEEIRIFAGPYNLQKTIISVRNNPDSPYHADVYEGKLSLFLEKHFIAEIELGSYPSYYKKILSNGKPVHEVAPTIEWGYLIYLTVFRQCQYWGKEEECLFCDINENYRQQKAAGRPYRTTKSPEEVLEALAIIANEESNARAYTITGGSITSSLQGKDEGKFFYQFAEAIENRFPKKWIGKAVMQALPQKDLQPFKDVGIQIYHPNYEIWDKKLFAIYCPGKERYVGREEWHKRILDSAEIFGAGNVIPNFVAGIEMAQPFGYTNPEEAVRSTVEGLDFFMSKGIMPRYTVWCPEPLTSLGSNNHAAPLEFHVRLMQGWRDTFERYNLPSPPGYGEAGLGRAVFSVSAFMDIIRDR